VDLETLYAGSSELTKHQRKRTGETKEEYVGRATHIHLEGKDLTSVGNILSVARRVEALYLQDNRITDATAPYDKLLSLTHLYLQRNRLSSLLTLGLSASTPALSLRKLYLDQNAIEHLHGLEGCPGLEELHISNQRLPPGRALTFDVESLMAVSNSLKILMCTKNNLSDPTELAKLAILRRLEILNLVDNNIESSLDMRPILERCGRLQKLDIAGNPCCKVEPKFRDTIILLSDSIANLDGKSVSGKERVFLLQLHMRRLQRQKQKEEGESEDYAEEGGGVGGGGGGGGGGMMAGRNKAHIPLEEIDPKDRDPIITGQVRSMNMIMAGQGFNASPSKIHDNRFAAGRENRGINLPPPPKVVKNFNTMFS